MKIALDLHQTKNKLPELPKDATRPFVIILNDNRVLTAMIFTQGGRMIFSASNGKNYYETAVWAWAELPERLDDEDERIELVEHYRADPQSRI